MTASLQKLENLLREPDEHVALLGEDLNPGSGNQRVESVPDLRGVHPRVLGSDQKECCRFDARELGVGKASRFAEVLPKVLRNQCVELRHCLLRIVCGANGCAESGVPGHVDGDNPKVLGPAARIAHPGDRVETSTVQQNQG